MAQANSTDTFKKIFLFGGPLLSLLFILLFDLSPGHPEITYTAAVAFLMALWWITETLPLAVTALLPLILFPAFGIMDGKAVSNEYVNHIIFIFIGGFMVALAMERWDLHKRLALRILMMFGIHPRFILLGFMVATAFLSMWISNTATTMMMLPIAIAIILKLDDVLGKERVRRFSIGVLLGIAYSASVGGIATLIGTPPNLVLLKVFSSSFPNEPEISFAKWFFFAFPISIVFLVIVWLVLSWIFCREKGINVDKQIFADQYKALGPVSFEEKVVLIDFFILLLLWIFRADIRIGEFTIPGWSNLFPEAKFINDGTVSVTMAFLLFMIPSKNGSGNGGRIMDWKTAKKLPWDIVLLFGGGFALAGGFKAGGLSAWLGNQLVGLGSLHPVLIILCICLLITFLTELTSNLATAQIFLPILAALAVSMKVNPLLLMIPAILSCSCAFMLPVATPPNAIVFGSGRLHVSEMARVGILLNLIGALVITAAVLLLGRSIFSL
ncbi:MAG: SLC13/DASS family transporter [bacterium]|nr:SLC13/DASS family transporter [bacterium]